MFASTVRVRKERLASCVIPAEPALAKAGAGIQNVRVNKKTARVQGAAMEQVFGVGLQKIMPCAANLLSAALVTAIVV